LEYEDIYKDNMVKFLDTIINKVTNISSFDTIMYLIRVDKIKENVNDYNDKLKDKFEIITKKEIERIEEKNLGKPVEIIVKFEKLIFENEGDYEFLEQKINKLKISYLVYDQLMRICKDDKYKTMKEFIFKIFLSNNDIKNVKSIIVLIDSLETSDKEAFLK
jgi:hypothetical protein